jgi:hypothetical protein
MNQQNENSRQDDQEISDKNIDVTRSQNRQAVGDASEGTDASEEVTNGGHGHHGGNETGSHQEAQYDKNSAKPMVDKDGMGEAGAGGDKED